MGVSTRKKLAKLVEEYGEALYEDERRCRSLLLDVIRNSRDVAVLSAAVSAGIVNDLKSSNSGMPFEARARVFAKRLHNEYGLSEDFALWSVESWALALGVVTEDDIATKKTNRSRNADERSKQTDAKRHDVATPIDSARDAKVESKKTNAAAEYQFALGEAVEKNCFLDIDKLAEAEKYYREAVSLDPENPKYKLALGRCLKLQDAIDGNPEAGRRHNKATAYLRFAEKYYQDALTQDPDNADCVFKLAQSLEYQSKTFEAEKFYRKAIALQPDNSVYLKSLGIMLYHQGRTEEALQLLKKAASLAPADFESRAISGVILLNNKDYTRAFPYLHNAVKLNPTDAYLQYSLGFCLFVGCNQPVEAEAHFRKAIELDENYAAAHFGLAASLESQGEYFEAERFYRKAIALQPDNPVCLKSLGRMLYYQDRTEEALQFLTKAASLDPADSGSLALIGLIFCNRKDYAQALPYFQDAVKLNPTDAHLQYWLGDCLFGCNQPIEAGAHFRKAVELDEDYAAAHYGLAVVLALQNKFKDAKYHAEKAAMLDPTNADYRSLADKISGSSSSSSSSGSDCFVATACFGDAGAHEVRLLRTYRDEILVRSRMGRAFISWYYTHGPKLADSIRYRPAVKLVVRNLLIRPCALMVGLFLRIKQNVGA